MKTKQILLSFVKYGDLIVDVQEDFDFLLLDYSKFMERLNNYIHWSKESIGIEEYSQITCSGYLEQNKEKILDLTKIKETIIFIMFDKGPDIWTVGTVEKRFGFFYDIVDARLYGKDKVKQFPIGTLKEYRQEDRTKLRAKDTYYNWDLIEKALQSSTSKED